MIKGPCKDCARRSVGCHGTCPEYLEFKSKNDNLKEIERLEKHKYYDGRSMTKVKFFNRKIKDRQKGIK